MNRSNLRWHPAGDDNWQCDFYSIECQRGWARSSYTLKYTGELVSVHRYLFQAKRAAYMHGRKLAALALRQVRPDTEPAID